MGNELKYYDISPRIVHAESQETITIRPLYDHARFTPGETYLAALVSCEGGQDQMTWETNKSAVIELQAGELRIPCSFPTEQEYSLLIFRGAQLVVKFQLYALESDLFDRRPYKGDFHLHTHHSDGVESPSYVAGSCRKIGLDFMAITDHHQYAPSLEAIRAFEGVDIDLQIYPGEEVHTPGNPVHILNFGGNFSVNALFENEEYKREVQEISVRLENFPENVDRYPYAACAWSFVKIREGGGLAVFCHPYWVSRHRLDVPMALTDLIIERQLYDALELIGGYHRQEVESNLLQVARYHEERAKGKRIPIVGVSDSHGCETGNLFGWYYTIVFSSSSKLPDLIQGIKDLYSVAVDALPGETARAHGPFRLVRYAQFLMREIFPAHDQLCVEEGRLMLAYLAGDTRAAATLHRMAGQNQKYYRHVWADQRSGF